MPRNAGSDALVITAPRRPAAPIVFDSPHSGFQFPRDFQPAASRRQIQSTWDAYVDELCGGVSEAGASLIAARFPRAYIDANRGADDIDPEILDTPWPRPVCLSDYSARGMGLIRRYTRPGVRLYDRLLTIDEVRGRLAGYYLPYRRALRQNIEAAWRRHDAVWHFNCHSMKSAGLGSTRGNPLPRPDFVIGDRDGTTAPAKLTQWVAQFFSRQGYSVGVNNPYRGADIIRAHGEPWRRRYSIQIEINRSLYMHESTCQRHDGFEPVRNTLTEFAQSVAALARQELAR